MSVLTDMSNKQTAVTLGLLGVLLSTIPFLHLGISYYLSAQILGVFALTLLVMLMGIHPNAAVIAPLGCALFMAKAVVELFSSGIQEVLLVMREMLCFLLIVVSIRQISYLSRPSILIRQYTAFLYFCLALISVQYLAILNGMFIQFPFKWFVMNEKTLGGIDLALEHGTRLRPVGFYGEPSYMAFVMVSALVVFLAMTAPGKKVAPVLALNLVVFVMLGSLSGMLAFILIVVVYYLQRNPYEAKPRNFKKFLLLCFVGCMALAILFLIGDFSSRITSLAANNDMDMSIYIRYVLPVLKLSEMFQDGAMFGYSKDDLPSIDNAFFYLLLHYGLIAPLLIMALAYYVRNRLLVVYLLVVLNFNGAYFSFDKAVVMSVVLGLSLGVMRNRMNVRAY